MNASVSAAALLVLVAAAAQAQQSPGGSSGDTAWGRGWGDPVAARRAPDFLFAEPRTSVTLRVGGFFPRQHSDAYTELFRFLVPKGQSFRSLAIGTDVGIRLTPRLDALISVGYAHSPSRATIDSAFVEYVGNDTVDIHQRTHLVVLPLTAGVKAYLTPRGQQVGHFAWIPSRVTPYVGAAGGVVWHRFQQSGDFVDRNDLSINNDELTSSGWAPTLHVFGGTEVGISRHAVLQAEVRYALGSANMGSQFEEYNKIDLAGLQTTIGISWRY